MTVVIAPILLSNEVSEKPGTVQFSFGAGGSAGTTYTARSSQPALVTADTTDRRLVLTPVAPARVTVTAARAGDSAEVEFTVEVEAAPSEVPAAPPLAQVLLALLLLGGGAYYRVRQARHWAR